MVISNWNLAFLTQSLQLIIPITQVKIIASVFGNWIFVSLAITHLCSTAIARSHSSSSCHWCRHRHCHCHFICSSSSRCHRPSEWPPPTRATRRTRPRRARPARRRHHCRHRCRCRRVWWARARAFRQARALSLLVRARPTCSCPSSMAVGIRTRCEWASGIIRCRRALTTFLRWVATWRIMLMLCRNRWMWTMIFRMRLFL